MNARPGLYVAIVTFALVIGAGGLLVRLAAERGEAQRRLQAWAAVDRAAAALERDIDAAFGELAAARDAQLRHGPSGRIESVMLVADGRALAALSPRGEALDAADLPPLEGEAPIVLGPLRGAGGAQKIAARLPAGVPDHPRASLVAVLDLGELLRASVSAHAAAYDFRLAATGARARAIATSGPAPLADAVAREMRVGADRWRLELAPRAGWTSRSALLFNGVAVLAAAFAASLIAFDLARERDTLRHALRTQRERLRAANRRIVEEVQQREALEGEFSRASFHDPLTGLKNRRLLASRLEQGLKTARVKGGAGALAFAVVELDRMKAAADILGPNVADELLVQAAQRLETGATYVQAEVGRLADAAFGFVLPQTPSREATLALVDRLLASFEKPFDIASQRIFVTAHAGLAFSQAGYDHPDDLVRGAHAALATARRERLPRAVFNEAAHEQVISRHQLESDLHGVDARGELRIAFQPVVALATGEVVGAEALVRWQHPVEGLLGPGRFIPLAEETGLIKPITRWMLREACAHSARWREERPGSRVYVSVNLSALDMEDPGIGQYIVDVLAQAGLPAEGLRVEVTESSMIDNLRTAVDLLGRLRAIGVQILLDDFGTGYSSLSYLHRFQIDYLKIDQSFVSRMSPDPKSSTVVRAILSLAEGMGIRTIAEGIETAEAAHALLALKCDFGQGYYYSRPVDPAGIEALLRKGRLRAPNQPTLTTSPSASTNT